MSRSIRTIVATGFAAASFVALAVPAHAARPSAPEVTTSVTASWEKAGALAGAPGNFHRTSFSIYDNGVTNDFTSIGVEDFQCPDAATPESGLCTSLRATLSMGQGDATVSGDRRLNVGSADVSIDGAWQVGEESTPAVLTVDVDVVGAGQLTRRTDRWVSVDGTKVVESTATRPVTLTGTVAGISVDGMPGVITRVTRR